MPQSWEPLFQSFNSISTLRPWSKSMIEWLCHLPPNETIVLSFTLRSLILLIPVEHLNLNNSKGRINTSIKILFPCSWLTLDLSKLPAQFPSSVGQLRLKPKLSLLFIFIFIFHFSLGIMMVWQLWAEFLPIKHNFQMIPMNILSCIQRCLQLVTALSFPRIYFLTLRLFQILPIPAVED